MQKITIVTVCYNAVNVLEKTIMSVLEQTYPNIEYIIIDGASTDGTPNIIEKYKDKLSFWSSEPDDGIYDAMNKGIKNSSGEWLNFMNAGDVFSSKYAIEKMAHHFSDINMVVYGNVIKCYDKYRIRDTGIIRKKIDAVDFFLDGINHQPAFIRKSMFDKYGLYDTNYRLASDWKFFMNVVGLGGEKTEYVNFDVALFAMDGASTNNQEKYQEEQYIIQKAEYGKYYNYMKELAEYRKSPLLSLLLKCRFYIKGTGLGHKIKTIIIFFNTLILKK